MSVIICTHAPSQQRLDRVLAALAAQSLDKSQWELLLVDNACPRPLSDLVDLSWHPEARHVREDRLGLTPARLRGIGEAEGDVLVFVDDDNVLASDYLSTALTLCRANPQLGVIGAGIIEPEFADEPERRVRPHLAALALREVRSARWSNNTDDHDSVPWGPGICVTRAVGKGYSALLSRLGVADLVDRRGDALFGNGDVMFSWSAVTVGTGFGIFPSLRVTHLIPPQRLRDDYLLRLARDSSFSNGVMDYLWAGRSPGTEGSVPERILRVVAHALRCGLFAARYRWATQQGAQRAREYIDRHRLVPIGPRSA